MSNSFGIIKKDYKNLNHIFYFNYNKKRHYTSKYIKSIKDLDTLNN